MAFFTGSVINPAILREPQHGSFHTWRLFHFGLDAIFHHEQLPYMEWDPIVAGWYVDIADVELEPPGKVIQQHDVLKHESEDSIQLVHKCTFCLGTGVPRHRDGIVQQYVCTYIRTSLANCVQYFSTS